MQEMSFEFELDEKSKKKLDELKRELELEVQETLEIASRVVDKEGLRYVKELY